MNYRFAGFGERAIALIIDSLIVVVVALPFWFFVDRLIFNIHPQFLGRPGETFGLSNAMALIISLYNAVYRLGKTGQSWGCQFCDIRVVNKEGTALGAGRALLRYVLSITLSSWPLMLGYFWMLFDAKSQTWHDKIAGSFVIKEGAK